MSILAVTSGTPIPAQTQMSTPQPTNKTLNGVAQNTFSQLGAQRQGCFVVAILFGLCKCLKCLGCDGNSTNGCANLCSDSQPPQNAPAAMATTAAVTASVATVIQPPQPSMTRDDDPPSTTQNSTVRVSVTETHTPPVQNKIDIYLESTHRPSSSETSNIPDAQRPASGSVSALKALWENKK